MMRHVRMFKPQFAPLVEAGTKRQTVRPVPKRTLRPGERISLRAWTGLPYRSKQRLLREAVITSVETFHICREDMMVAGVMLNHAEADAFARADGFSSALAMSEWFEAAHGLPFDGVVLYWQPVNMRGL